MTVCPQEALFGRDVLERTQRVTVLQEAGEARSLLLYRAALAAGGDGVSRTTIPQIPIASDLGCIPLSILDMSVRRRRRRRPCCPRSRSATRRAWCSSPPDTPKHMNASGLVCFLPLKCLIIRFASLQKGLKQLSVPSSQVGNVVSGMVSTAAAALALVEQSLPPVRTTATTAVPALI